VQARANFEDYRTEDGKKRFLAVIRIKGFKRTSRAFGSMRRAASPRCDRFAEAADPADTWLGDDG